MLVEVFLGFAAVVAVLWILSSPFYWTLRGVPCRIPYPLVGNMAGLFTKGIRDFWTEKYFEWKEAKYVGIHFLMVPALMIRDLEVVKRLLTSDNFLSMGFYTNAKRDLFAWSVLYSSGENWRWTRSKLSPFFTTARIKAMLPICDESLERTVSEMSEYAGSMRPLNVHDIAMRLSTDVITKVSFGLESDAYDNDSFLVKIQGEMLKARTHMVVLLSILSPWLYDLLKLKSFREHIYTDLKRVIGGSISYREKGIGVRPDFIQGMVEEKRKDTNKNGLNGEEPQTLRINDEFIIAQGMTLYMAGTEPFGNNLAFVLYELSYHEEIQEKARQEIFKVTKGTGIIQSYEELMDLKYLNSIIYEGLRLYPLLSTLTRKCTKDYVLDHFTIKKGTMVQVPVVGINMDPDYFPQPETFDPDRFQADNKQGIFMPFGYGQRICLGMKYGLMNLTFSLSRILSKYRVSPSSRTERPLKFQAMAVTTTPANGIWLNLHAIKNQDVQGKS